MRREPGRRGRPPAFDEPALLDAAVAVIERNGLDGTTLNDVAAELGVTAMAVYRVCDSKDDLLDRIPDFLVHGIGEQIEAAAGALETLRAAAEAVGAVLDEHPGCAPLFHRPQLGPNMTAMAALIIEPLVTDGCAPARAAGILRSTMALVVGLRVTGGSSAEAALGPIAEDALAIWLCGVAAELAP